ncbi:MAG TPA: PEP-utilizing enzyme [Nitrospiraceae bacterium]|nr:PEP-utilizing enzyme [Nitrospiraceae bacterium]
MAQSRPAVREILERLDDTTAARLAGADNDFATAFTAYRNEFGNRTLREISDQTLAEEPLLILRLVRDQLAREYDPAADMAALEQERMTALVEARSLLGNRSAEDRERFERALTRGEQAYPVREDNQFYTVSSPLALMRYAVLELGRRLADRRQISGRDDVFFFELEEARSALRTKEDFRPLVERRKAERAWVEAHPGPAAYGRDPGPPLPFDAFPREAKFLMEAMLWAMKLVFSPDHAGHRQADAPMLHGIAASPGVYTGTVRIIMNEAEFDKLQPGDVLVCPITSPVWSVLFPSVGALVTETGGILSHPAIIAREYRVPAVVACENATRLLRDGQNVTVNGNNGIVEKRS